MIYIFNESIIFVKNNKQSRDFGILISLVLFMLIYIILDRHTALNPIQKTTISLKEKVNNL